MKIAYLLPRLDNKSSISIFKDLIPQLKRIDENLVADIYYFDEEVSLNFNENTQRISFFDIKKLNQYDIIHTSGIRPNLFVSLNKWRFNSSIKFITTIHSFIYEDFKNQFKTVFAAMFSSIWYKVLKSQDTVVVLTNVAKKYYSNKIKSNLEVVNNGRAEIKYEPLSEADLETMEFIRRNFRFVIGTHAVISKIKALDIVIRSLAKLNSFCFVIIGDGPELKNLKNLTSSLGLEHSVFFLGFKNNIGAFFKYYDLYVMPSKSEGLPLALVEAVSQKIPCLTSDIPTFKELFEDDEVAKFKLDDTDDFVQKTMLFTESNYTNSLVKKAYAKYIHKYTDVVMAKNYYELYTNLIKS